LGIQANTGNFIPAIASKLYILLTGVDLTALQTDFRGTGRREPQAFGAVALLCLILLALLVTVALHSAAPIAVMAALVVMVKSGAFVQLAEARPVVRHWNPKLFTRPPPAGR